MIKKRFLDFIYILLGIVIISYILYIRVLRDMLPTNLPLNLFSNKHYFILILYLILFSLFFYIFIISVKRTLFIEYKLGSLPTSNIFTNKLSFLSHLWSISLEKLSLFIIDYTPIHKYLYKILSHFGLFCYKNFLGSKQIQIIIILTHIIPKSIFLAAFITDVMIFHQFNYVYKVSFLMLIPLIELGLHYMIETYIRENFINTDEVISIWTIPERNGVPSENYFKHFLVKKYRLKSTKYPLNTHDFNFNFTPEFLSKSVNLGFKMLYELNEVLIPIAEFNFFYEGYKSKILGYFNILLFFGYTSIWGYMLFYCW